MNCLDYGLSFINSVGNGNAPRFWVESRCRLIDDTDEASTTITNVVRVRVNTLLRRKISSSIQTTISSPSLVKST